MDFQSSLSPSVGERAELCAALTPNIDTDMTMMGKFLTLLESTERRPLVLVLVGTLIAGLLEMIGLSTVPAFVGVMVDPEWVFSVFVGILRPDWIREIKRPNLLLLGAALLCGVFLVKNLYLVALVYRETQFVQSLKASISNRLFRAYLNSPYHFHLQRNPAEIIRNLTEEAVYTMDFVRAGLRLIREGLVLALVFLLMLVVEPAVSVTVFSLLAVVSGGFYVAVRQMLLRHGRLWGNHWSRRVQIISQSFGAIKDAKILGREPHLMKLFHSETASLQRHETCHEFTSLLPRYFLETLAMAVVVLIAVTFLLFDRPIGGLLPILALYGVAVTRLLPAMTTINSSLVEIRYRRPALDLVCAELKEREVHVTAQAGDSGMQPVSKKMLESITFENIHYRYPGATSEALHGVSATIQAGTAVGILGTSGAGKSTLIDILLGLLTPTDGRVLVDGTDIRHDLAAWQRQIGYVPQNIYLLDDSIRRNIAFGLPDDKIDDSAVARAMQAAQIDAFVGSLPQGPETPVGHEGVRLSGGQRQRIAIARALYHDPSVLVMDEATNSLDDGTENDLMEAVRALQNKKTLIIVAHRLSTVDGCDQLFRLEAGRLVSECKMAVVG